MKPELVGGAGSPGADVPIPKRLYVLLRPLHLFLLLLPLVEPPRPHGSSCLILSQKNSFIPKFPYNGEINLHQHREKLSKLLELIRPALFNVRSPVEYFKKRRRSEVGLISCFLAPPHSLQPPSLFKRT